MVAVGRAIHGGGAFLAPLVPDRLFASWFQGASQQAADPVAGFRTQMGAVPIQPQKLADNVTLLSGPGGNVVVLDGPGGKILTSFHPRGRNSTLCFRELRPWQRLSGRGRKLQP